MKYQIAPYTFSVAVVGMPNDLRPLDNLNAATRGSEAFSVLDLIAKAGAAQGTEQRLAPETDPEELVATSSIGISAVHRSGHVVTLDVTSGRRGVRADIDRTREGRQEVVDVVEADWALTPTRCVFFAPPGSKKGLALVEKAGHIGAATAVTTIIDAALKMRYPDLRFRHSPATTPEFVESWAKQSLVKGIVLQHTNVKTGESAGSVHGLPVTTVFSIKPPRKRGWPWSRFVDKMDSSAQRAILTEVIPQLQLSATATSTDVEKTASEMIENGWRVRLELERDGKKRTVHVEAQAKLSMSFPASVENTMSRPGHDDFVAACQATLNDLAAANLSVGDAGLCQWPTTTWEDRDDPWKAVWGVPKSKPSGGSA